MKKLIFLIAGWVGIFLIAGFGIVIAQNFEKKPDKPTKILCTPDLLKLTKQWTITYNKDAKFEVQVMNPDDLSYEMRDGEHVAFVSEGSYSKLDDKSDWKIILGRNVIVPVVNANNPCIGQIRESGISAAKLADVFAGNQKADWGFIDEKGAGHPIIMQLSDDKFVADALVNFLGTGKPILTGNSKKSGREIASAVQQDIYALGFCKLTDIIDPENGEIMGNVALLPIDRNSSGKIEHFEEIYGNIFDFTRGVWIGKYPPSLVENIYAVGNTTRLNPDEAAFVKWVVTGGQNLLEPMGFTSLASAEKQSTLEKWNTPVTYPVAKNTYASAPIVIFIIAIFIVMGLLAGLFFYRSKKPLTGNINGEPGNDSGERPLTFPKGLYFDRSHTWAFLEKNGNVRIGIDDFLQNIAGNFTRVKMKAPGDKIKKNETLMSVIQNGKQLNIYSPVSGTIIGVNDALGSEPSLINSSPYNDGWVCMIEPANWLREVQLLKMAESHKEWLKAEFIKLKDFLSSRMPDHSGLAPQFALQDGGVIKGHVLEEMSPEVWEDFQKEFMDHCGVI